MRENSKVSPVIFIASILCFLFPFMTVSCGGHQVASFTGAQLAIGTTVEQPQMFGPPQKQKVDPDPFAALAGLCAVIGMASSFTGTGTAIVQAICGALGSLSLFLMKSRMDDQILKQGRGMLQVNYETGFSFALVLLIAGAAWNAFLFSQRKRDIITDLPLAQQSNGGSEHASREGPGPSATPPISGPGHSPAQHFPNTDTNVCSNCGAETGETSKFCKSCGKPVGAITQT